MLGIAAFALVLIASAIIGGSFFWASRNGTLRESDRERFDRRFDEIVMTETYSNSRRRS